MIAINETSVALQSYMILKDDRSKAVRLESWNKIDRSLDDCCGWLTSGVSAETVFATEQGQDMIRDSSQLVQRNAWSRQSGCFHPGYGNMHSMDHRGVPRFVGLDDPNQLFFQLREFSLFMDFAVTDGVTASLEIEAGQNANRFTPNYAYVDFDIGIIFPCYWNEERFGSLHVRAGNVLVPFLSFNENKPNFRQFLVSPPFTAQNFVPVVPLPPDFFGLGWSDTGLVFDWTKEISDRGFLNVKATVIEGLGSDTNALDSNSLQLAGGPFPHVRPRDGLVANEQGQVRDRNDGKAFVLKTSLTSSERPIDFGFSWYKGAWSPDSMLDMQMWGVHFNWLEEDWTLKGEWGLAHIQQNAGFDPVADAGLAPSPGLNTTTGSYNMRSWYLEASRVVHRWRRCTPCKSGDEEQECDRNLRLIGRYDYIQTNDKVSFTPWHRDRMTLGLELQFTSNSRFRYEYQHHWLNDYSAAPAPYVAAGGQPTVSMHMASCIFWF